MNRIIAVARAETLVLRRNRWLLTIVLILSAFALALSFAGSAPTGALGVDMLTISVTSMTTLAVYLIPLLALMISFDAIAGEADRGSLGLLLSYPASRAELLLGKALAHLLALFVACAIGFGLAGIIAAVTGGVSDESLLALIRLVVTSVLLGAAFLALGYLISSIAGTSATAAGYSAALWLVFVVLYDLALLASVLVDSGGSYTRHIFPWLLTANPADAFRLWNIAGSDATALAAGMTGVADSLPDWAAPVSLLLWPVLAFLAARAAFRRLEP